MSRNKKILFGTIALALALLAAVATRAKYGRYTPNDDFLWFYYTGIEIGNPALSLKNTDYVLERLREIPVSPKNFNRYEIRKKYNKNYYANSLIYLGTTEIVKKAGVYSEVKMNSDYPLFISSAYFWSFQATFFISFAILIGILLLERSCGFKSILGLSIALILTAVFSHAADLYPIFRASELPIPDLILGKLSYLGTSFYNIAAYKDWAGMLDASMATLITPHIDFTPFGYSARCSFIMLAFGLFYLRLRGRFALSYTLLALMGFFHQSNAGLVLGFLVVTDLLIRPRVFLSNRVLSSACAVLAIYLFREKIMYFSAQLSGPFWTSAGVALIIGAAVILCKERLIPIWEKCLPSRILKRIPEQFLIRDHVVVAAIWFLTLPLAQYMHFKVIENSAVLDYVWEQIHGRSLTVLRLGLFLSAGFLLVELVSGITFNLRKVIAITTAMAAVAFPMFLTSPALTDGLDLNLKAFETYERQLTSPISTEKEAHAREDQVYYALVKSLHTGQDTLKNLFPIRR